MTALDKAFIDEPKAKNLAKIPDPSLHAQGDKQAKGAHQTAAI